MTADPDALRSKIDALVEATASSVIEAAGSDAFAAVVEAHLGHDRPTDVTLKAERWRRGSVFSTMLLGALVDDSESERPPDATRVRRVRELVDGGSAAMSQLVVEHRAAVISIYEGLYGDGAVGDPSDHDLRDVAISLFASFDAEESGIDPRDR